MPTTLESPLTDPTPIFEFFRGNYGSELLTAAVAHFDVFDLLCVSPLTLDQLQAHSNIEARPTNVLVTVLRAFGLIQQNSDGKFELTPLAVEHLAPDAYFGVNHYVGLAADSPGVLEMVERLKTNQPAGAADDEGAAFIYRDGIESAMEREATARYFTMALCGRAKNVAPLLGDQVSMAGVQWLLDVGGGTGIYSIAFLERYPALRAIVFDRPEVLKVAAEMAKEYGVEDRLECRAGDMFSDPLPENCDAILLSNILHDWDVPECQRLVQRCADVVPPGGRVLIHDVFLNDDLDGPLPIALYSAALFTVTEGRAYSAREYSQWLSQAGLDPQPIVPTLVHCGVLAGVSRNKTT